MNGTPCLSLWERWTSEARTERVYQGAVPSQSLRDSSPRVGAKGERRKRIVTGGNPWKGPHQRARWFAMTWFFDSLPIKIFKKDFNCLKGMEFI